MGFTESESRAVVRAFKRRRTRSFPRRNSRLRTREDAVSNFPGPPPDRSHRSHLAAVRCRENNSIIK